MCARLFARSNSPINKVLDELQNVGHATQPRQNLDFAFNGCRRRAATKLACTHTRARSLARTQCAHTAPLHHHQAHRNNAADHKAKRQRTCRAAANLFHTSLLHNFNCHAFERANVVRVFDFAVTTFQFCSHAGRACGRKRTERKHSCCERRS